MSLVQITDLTYSYDGSYDNVFEHVDLQFDTDWRLGLVGRNGKGKTTLLKLLTGELRPAAGTISASVRFDYFPYPVGDVARLTREVLEQAAPEVAPWRLNKELAALELDPTVLTRPFCTLSNGEQTRCLLALLFLRENHFLLIDEPTNHLDMAGRAAAARYLRRQKGFLLVSHDRAFLDGCVDHIISLNRSDIDIQQGNFSTWWENKRRRDDFERGENDKLLREITRLTAAAQQSSRWADRVEGRKIGHDPHGDKLQPNARAYLGEKSRRMQQRRKNLERRQSAAIQEKEALLKNIETTRALELRPLRHPKQKLLEVRDLTIDYGTGPLWPPVTFTVEQGDRLVFTGRNGAGKSSLLKLLAGEDVPHSGKVAAASNLVVSVVPQDASFLRGSPADYARASGVDLTRFLSFLRKLDFPRMQFEKNMEDFSAGQRKKVLLARSLSESAHIYIWDEPLNYIDVFSRMQLEDLLRVFPATLLLVEHDRTFLDTVGAREVPLGT